MSLHILQLGPYPPPEGGITRNMIAIRDVLEERGDKCSIIATSRRASVTDACDVFHPRSPLELSRLLRSLSYDVVHLHIGGDVTTRVLLLALTVTLFGGRRSVLTMHSGGYATDDRAKGAFAKYVFRRFGKVVAVNNDLADVLRRLGVDDDRIKIIAPYALNRPDASVSIPTEFESFYEAHSPVLLSVGGFEPEYEPLLQIAAMKKVLDRHPNAGLMILGGGSMKTEVEAAVRELPYADSIMLAGNLEHGVALHLLERADAMLRITQFDGDAISVREALFLGTPVIATDTGMRPDGVHLIGRGNEAALVDAISNVVVKKRTQRGVDDGYQNIREVLDLYDRLTAAQGEHCVEAIAD